MFHISVLLWYMLSNIQVEFNSSFTVQNNCHLSIRFQTEMHNGTRRRLNIGNPYVNFMLVIIYINKAPWTRRKKERQDKKKTTSVFGFWLTDSKNTDFVTQYFDNNAIFGNALFDFPCRVYLPVNKWVKKIVIWLLLNHVYGSLKLIFFIMYFCKEQWSFVWKLHER